MVFSSVVVVVVRGQRTRAIVVEPEPVQACRCHGAGKQCEGGRLGKRARRVYACARSTSGRIEGQAVAGSESRQGVAVIVVHGVADQRPGDTAKAVAQLLVAAPPGEAQY